MPPGPRVSNLPRMFQVPEPHSHGEARLSPSLCSAPAPCTLSSMRPSLPERAQFLRLARTHSLVPLYRTLTADLETPVSAFLRLAAPAGKREQEPECFLSPLKAASTWAATPTSASAPAAVSSPTESRSRSPSTARRERSPATFSPCCAMRFTDTNPLASLASRLFTAGAVGFLAYDVVRQIERLPVDTADDLQLPDACLMFFDEVLAFDHVKKEILLLIVTADLRHHKPQAAYVDALRRLDRFEKRLAQPLSKLGVRKTAAKSPRLGYEEGRVPPSRSPGEGIYRRRRHLPGRPLPALRLRAWRRPLLGLPRPSHRQPFALHVLPALRPRWSPGVKAKEIHARQETPTHLICRLLARVLVRVHGRRIEYRPIAGTRPRGANEED